MWCDSIQQIYLNGCNKNELFDGKVNMLINKKNPLWKANFMRLICCRYVSYSYLDLKNTGEEIVDEIIKRPNMSLW